MSTQSKKELIINYYANKTNLNSIEIPEKLSHALPSYKLAFYEYLRDYVHEDDSREFILDLTQESAQARDEIINFFYDHNLDIIIKTITWEHIGRDYEE